MYMQVANTIVQVITVIMFPNGFLQFLTEIKCLSFFPIGVLSVSLRVPCTIAFQYLKYSLIYCVRCRVPVLSMEKYKYKTYNCYQSLIVNKVH